MSDLRANTDVMRSGANTISTSADVLTQVANQISNFNNQLGGQYQGQLQEKVSPMLSQVISEGNRLQGQSGQFGASLNSLAGQIDDAMHQQGALVMSFPGSSVANSSLSKFFSQIEQLSLGVVTTVLSWIGFRTAVPVTQIPSITTPVPSSQQSPPNQTTSADIVAQERRNRGAALVDEYDGTTYAQGTYNSKDSYSARPVDPPVTNKEGDRDPNIYNATLNQFGVETNPRYTSRNNNTYCNIFVWDATKAMNAEIPHWVDANGTPVAVGQGRELSANGVVNWLSNHGSDYGWHIVSAEEAQARANQGAPAVVVWANSNLGESGHVAMIRPGEYSSTNGPNIAQAGASNYNNTAVSQTFGNRQVTYYAHD